VLRGGLVSLGSVSAPNPSLRLVSGGCGWLPQLLLYGPPAHVISIIGPLFIYTGLFHVLGVRSVLDARSRRPIMAGHVGPVQWQACGCICCSPAADLRAKKKKLRPSLRKQKGPRSLSQGAGSHAKHGLSVVHRHTAADWPYRIAKHGVSGTSVNSCGFTHTCESVTCWAIAYCLLKKQLKLAYACYY